MNRLLPLLPAIALSCLIPFAYAHDTGVQMAGAADFFLKSLTEDQRARASFPFADEERENWHFIPKERKGLPLRDMTPQQRLLAHALLSTALGARGTLKANTIMSLEEVLYTIEGADEAKRPAVRERRDPEKYFVSIFGQPTAQGTWGWRWEGHHMSLNFTVKGGQLLRVTPTFMGSNPGEIREGPLAGLRVLGREEDLGRDLVTSLSPEQAAKAIVSATAPKDILTEAQKKVAPLEPVGLADTDLTADQKTKLHAIIHEYLQRMRPEIAEESWAEIQKSGPIHFAWAGGTQRGEGHYYRVQGKSFLLEYDNTQNNANHPHSVWRGFDGDFGHDLLAEHLKSEHGN